LTGAQQSGSAYVTISAHPRLVRLGTGGGGYLDFTGYDVPFTVTPPAAAQTVDGASFNF